MKDPKVKRLPSGNYNCRLQLGGECISITRATEKECLAEARCIKSDYLAGKRFEQNRKAGDKTLKEVQEDFIKRNRPVLSPSTVKGYEQMKNGRWEDYRDQPLKRIQWQDMVNDELAKVKPKTVKNAWALVSASLKLAGYPVPNVKLAQCPVKEIDLLQPDEILKFCDDIKGRSYEIPALLMLHGLRLSEVRGLTWGDVDLKRGAIRVAGAVVNGPAGETRKETNKNRTSTRTVPIMIPRLKELLSEQMPTGKNETRQDEAVVKQHPSPLLRDIKRASKRVTGREITNQGLRHSFASLCYHIGPEIPERQVMQWGGWANIQTMHKIYIRVAAKDENDARKAFQRFFTGDQASEKQKRKQKRHQKVQ